MVGLDISSRDNARPRPPIFIFPLGGGVPPAFVWAVPGVTDPTAAGAFDVAEFVAPLEVVVGTDVSTVAGAEGIVWTDVLEMLIVGGAIIAWFIGLIGLTGLITLVTLVKDFTQESDVVSHPLQTGEPYGSGHVDVLVC